jgi:hypothetical protein
MTKGRPQVLAALGFLLPTLALPAGPVSASGRRRDRVRSLTYEARRPALDVSVTRRGDRIVRASVGAPGLCEDGERPEMGFEPGRGSAHPIRAGGRFEVRYGPRSYLRGRFAGRRFIGSFRESRRRQVEGEAIEPLCGNMVPRGRNQRFVARLVR